MVWYEAVGIALELICGIFLVTVSIIFVRKYRLANRHYLMKGRVPSHMYSISVLLSYSLFMMPIAWFVSKDNTGAGLTIIGTCHMSIFMVSAVSILRVYTVYRRLQIERSNLLKRHDNKIHNSLKAISEPVSSLDVQESPSTPDLQQLKQQQSLQLQQQQRQQSQPLRPPSMDNTREKSIEISNASTLSMHTGNPIEESSTRRDNKLESLDEQKENFTKIESIVKVESVSQPTKSEIEDKPKSIDSIMEDTNAVDQAAAHRRLSTIEEPSCEQFLYNIPTRMLYGIYWAYITLLGLFIFLIWQLKLTYQLSYLIILPWGLLILELVYLLWRSRLWDDVIGSFQECVKTAIVMYFLGFFWTLLWIWCKFDIASICSNTRYHWSLIIIHLSFAGVASYMFVSPLLLFLQFNRRSTRSEEIPRTNTIKKLQMNKEDLRKLAENSGTAADTSQFQALERIRTKLERRVQLYEYLTSDVTDEYDFFAHFLSQCYAIENLSFLAHVLIFRSMVLDLHSQLTTNGRYKTVDTFYPHGRKEIFKLNFKYLTNIEKGYRAYIDANTTEIKGGPNERHQWVDVRPYRDIAITLYDAFIGERATSEVNLPSSMKAGIKLFFDEKFYEYWRREYDKSQPNNPNEESESKEIEAKHAEVRKIGLYGMNVNPTNNPDVVHFKENKGRLKQQELIEKYLVVFNDAIAEVYGLLQKMYSFEFPRWAERQLSNWATKKARSASVSNKSRNNFAKSNRV